MWSNAAAYAEVELMDWSCGREKFLYRGTGTTHIKHSRQAEETATHAQPQGTRWAAQ